MCNIDFEYDRTWKNDDGQTFYGVDDEDTGTTEWYDGSGGLDSVTDTPSEDEQTAHDEGWI